MSDIIEEIFPEQPKIVEIHTGVIGRRGLKGDPGESSVTLAVIDSAIHAHAIAPTPHTAYDADIQNLSLLFENGIA